MFGSGGGGNGGVGGVWSGDHSLLSSRPGRPRKERWRRRLESGWTKKALLPRASGERWVFTYMYGRLGLSGLVGSRG